MNISKYWKAVNTDETFIKESIKRVYLDRVWTVLCHVILNFIIN